MKQMMRRAIAMALVLGCARPDADGSPAKDKPVASAASAPGAKAVDAAGAKAANARGLALLRQHKRAAAAAAFRQAIALDPGHVLAHYNLACTGADHDEAVAALGWVSNRAAWDSQAKAAIVKAPEDPDLKGIFDDQAAEAFVEKETYEPLSVLVATDPRHQGQLLTAADQQRRARELAAAPGKHDDECDPADSKQGRVYGLLLTSGDASKHTLVASLRDGVGLVDPSGALVARSEPIGCTASGASQDMLTGVHYQNGARMTPQTGNTTGLFDVAFYIVQYSRGGRADWTTNVAVFRQRGKDLIRVFDAPLTRSDGPGVGTVAQSALGDLIYVAPGDKQKRVFEWDDGAFRFVPLR